MEDLRLPILDTRYCMTDEISTNYDEINQTVPNVVSVSDLEPICETERPSFCVELMKRLDLQRGQNYLCDITLVAKEGKEFKAHRNVLVAASPFFAKLLQSDMKEKELGVIRFEEISESILGDVLEFIYTGRVEINEGNAKDLIIAADYLLLVCLKTKSGRFLEKQMTSSNCISILHFSEKYRCEELVANSTKFIRDNFASVAESDEFLNLEVEEVENWISSEKICVAAEEDVFRIIHKWIEQNESERKDKFEQLFRHVRLVLLSRDYLLDDVVTNELVTEHLSCLRQVLDAIKLVRSASEDTLLQSPGRRLETHAIVVRGGKYTYCYLPEKDTWKRLADGLSEEGDQTAEMIKFRDQLYAFPRNSKAKAERYDPAFNSWATLSLSPPSSYQTNSLAVVRGQIYAITNKSTIQRYDVELCAWRTISSSQEGYHKYGCCVIACGNCLYVLGGGGYLCSAKASRFDTVENKWEEIASMKIERNSAFGVASQGKIFIAEGVRGWDNSTSCEVYNVSTNEWQSIGRLNTYHLGGSMVCLNGTLYVLGGSDPNGLSSEANNTVERYDPTVNKWIVKTSIPVEESSKGQKHSFKACALKLSKGVLDKLQCIPAKNSLVAVGFNKKTSLRLSRR